MHTRIIHRFSQPTQFDESEYGTIFLVGCDEDKKELWTQVSKDSSKPNWISLGSFPSSSPEENIREFVEKTLKS